MSVLTGKCDICEKALLDVSDLYGKRKIRGCYSYHKVGEQNIFGLTKYDVYTKDICEGCYYKIVTYIETLKAKAEADSFKEAFK